MVIFRRSEKTWLTYFPILPRRSISSLSRQHLDIVIWRLESNPSLGIGVYSLTWLVVALEKDMEMPRIVASRSHKKGIEVTTNAIPQYSSGRIGIASAMTKTKGSPRRILP
ncbi:hypothetical protein N7520_009116 [Penicillium odoratum]|uniref:uncharacterized protein n=1 Tax=Penicillium odoratum TaxID=1167516 RepID=UPI00254891C6|nr:uncharacterized protein N7520_009116 [Penicillium odoratum]KAJ5752199.1 hypothetical protein N7520_009116 [Penicillium odoratum]